MHFPGYTGVVILNNIEGYLERLAFVHNPLN
jgi:hypothetical protein